MATQKVTNQALFVSFEKLLKRVSRIETAMAKHGKTIDDLWAFRSHVNQQITLWNDFKKRIDLMTSHIKNEKEAWVSQADSKIGRAQHDVSILQDDMDRLWERFSTIDPEIMVSLKRVEKPKKEEYPTQGFSVQVFNYKDIK